MRPEDLPLEPKLLTELRRVAIRHDISPIFLRNYSATPNHPIAKPFQVLEAEARELLGAVTDDELCAIARCIPDGFRRLEPTTMPILDRGERIAALAPIVVEWRVLLLGRDFREILLLKPEDGEVLETYPELADLLDDDQLLHIDKRFHLADGAILYKQHALYYHQLLRRSYTARPNFDFLSRFARHATSSDNACRIAIDHSRMLPIEYYSRLVELDAWYGPPWNAETLDDPNAVGLTVVGRNPNSLLGTINRLRFTDFLWTHRDGIKTFQIEEVSEPDYQFGPFIFNRYVHSERDIHSRQLRHLDGAVKVYPSEAYEYRLDTHLPNVERCHIKPKLFRIDGNIPLEVWLELIGYFFRSNEMILEYFDPEAFKRRIPLRVRDIEAWRAAGEPDDHEP